MQDQKSDNSLTRPHRYSLGDIEITILSDGHRTFPLPDGFVVNATREEINAALAAASMPRDIMTIVFNPVVVRSGGKTVLFDTGNGPQSASATFGRMPDSMAAAGIDVAAIDRVVISHFHSDHVNGLKTVEGTPAFANADILVPATEWDFWMSYDEAAKAATPRMQELFRNNRRIFGDLSHRVARYVNDEEVVPGVRAVSTPGHSIGHMSFMLASGGHSLFLQSDVTNHPSLFVANPGWHAMFDQIPNLAEKTRRRVYDMLVTDRLPVLGFHHPAPSVSHVEKTTTGYHLIPLDRL
jgi:glyoxylase-like metal-dependent hydrolase (beta-lactamase superfamily II)